MFYTGAPQNTARIPINNELTSKALELMKENNIDIKNVVVHAPYIINLANSNNFDFNVRFLTARLLFLCTDPFFLASASIGERSLEELDISTRAEVMMLILTSSSEMDFFPMLELIKSSPDEDFDFTTFLIVFLFMVYLPCILVPLSQKV
jgi:hypothetical protein